MNFTSSSEDVMPLKSKLHPEILTLGCNSKRDLAHNTLRLVSVLVCDSVLSGTYAHADDYHKNWFRSSTISSVRNKLVYNPCRVRMSACLWSRVEYFCVTLLSWTHALLSTVQCVFSRACSSLRTEEVKTIKMTNEPVKEILGAPKHPDSVTTEKSNNNDCVITTIPLVSECQLTAATGGAELSCYRCTIPFGVVILIAGIVVTAVAYSFNSHGSIISVFGLVLLSSGLLLLASSAVCWKIRQQNKKAKRRESQTALVANQRTLFG